jgi:hypothetical protein
VIAAMHAPATTATTTTTMMTMRVEFLAGIFPPYRTPESLASQGGAAAPHADPLPEENGNANLR